jgi:folate-binding protein YgfZ
MAERTRLYEACAENGAEFMETSGWLVPRRFKGFEEDYRHAVQEAAVFDLSDRGKMELAGRDGQSFLHNLCTNDILHLAPGRGCEAFFTTLKAKVVAHAFIYRAEATAEEPSLWIDVAASATERLFKHLNRYLISEQVEINDRTKEFAQIHLAGPKAMSMLRQVAGHGLADLADLELRPISVGPSQCQLRRRDLLSVRGYDLLCPGQHAAAVWRTLTQAGAQPAGAEAFEVLRIEAGTPEEGVDFDENHLVMELGRTKQAISYTKGCYLGQEPVVRSRDLGHVNRTLLGVKMRARSAVKSGTKLLREGNEVGQITSSAYSPRLDTAIALAYIRRGNQDLGTVLHVGTEGEQTTAEVVSLPFML